MKRYLLDTSALLTPSDDEPGADRVAALLAEARRREAVCLGCFMTLKDPEFAGVPVEQEALRYR